eukprot:2982491-Prymnesium_polylepis.1
MGRLAPNEISNALMPWAVGTSVILEWEGGAKPGRSVTPKSTIPVDRTRPCASTSGANDPTHRSRKLP